MAGSEGGGGVRVPTRRGGSGGLSCLWLVFGLRAADFRTSIVQPAGSKDMYGIVRSNRAADGIIAMVRRTGTRADVIIILLHILPLPL